MTVRQVPHRGRSYGVNSELLDQSPEWQPHWRRAEVGREENASIDLWYADEQSVREKYWLPEAGDVVIDVGCSIGSWTLPALIWGARVYAVDPRANSLALVRAISDENQVDPAQLVTVNAALAEDGGYPTDFRAAIGARGGFHAPVDATYTTLDKLVVDYQLPRVDWIKIDVEGAELSVLRGGVNALRNFNPTVIVEDHTGLYPWVGPMQIREQWQNLLQGLGYNMYSEFYTESPSDTGNIDRYFWICEHRAEVIMTSE